MKRVAEHDINELASLVIAYNKDGMESLRKGQLKASLEQLRYSEVLCIQNHSKIHPSLLAVTLNNLGCYYRKTLKYNAALSYLRQALQIELSVASCDFTVAGTHLNVCAVLSKLMKHEKAVLHATCALELLLNHIRNKREKQEEIGIDEYSVLAIAYFNIAAEYEHLYLWDTAVDAYHQGREFAEAYLGENHSLTVALGKAKLASLKSSELHRRRAQKNASLRDRKRPLSSRASRPRQSPRPQSGVKSAISRPYSAATRPPMPSRHDEDELRRPPTRRGLSLARPPSHDADSVRPSSRHGPGLARPLSREEQPPTMQEPDGGGLPPAWAEQKVDYWQALDDDGANRTTRGQEDQEDQKDAPEINHPSAYSPHSTIFPTMTPLCLANALVASPDVCSTVAKFSCDTMPLDATLGTSASIIVGQKEGSNSGELGHTVAGECMSQSELPRLPALTEIRVDDPEKSSLVPKPPSEPRTKAPRNNRHSEPLAQKKKEEKDTVVWVNSVWEELDGFYDPKAPSETRPNRIIKGTSRTSMALRQSNIPNTVTTEISAGPASTSSPSRSAVPNTPNTAVAAECIQRHWRASRTCHVHIAEHGAATKMQAVWRSFVVRRDRTYRAAVLIQKVARGVGVRLSRRRHTAASIIQARHRGAHTRRSLQERREKALVVQKYVRGNAGRRLFSSVNKENQAAAVYIQRTYRTYVEWRGRRAAQSAVYDAERREYAAISMQKLYRANKGREIAAEIWHESRRRDQAATKLQAEQRRRVSAKYVHELREKDVARKNSCAVTIRKHWLRFCHRKHYLGLKANFAIREAQIVTIQRYARGCIQRAYLKRRLMQEQQEYDAACWIQHLWRGHKRHASWKKRYKEQSELHASAFCIQRHWRLWLAKVRCAQVRSASERKENEQRELNFRAARKIQALRRGEVGRRYASDMRADLSKRCVDIQRVWRGHVYRQTMWDSALNFRAVIIQATVRGYLARKRMGMSSAVDGMSE
eukprot:GEMP01007990.1.p1 GENE.GEMP01007990.1~~GEMP01007990.1.p1  ORF type:complete len:990 (-),score=225.42 GEMP01007990.1:488-3457(-)